MITNISLVTVYCLDQDAARDFYVDVLGFEPRTDVSMGEGFRWVTVGHPSQPELEVTLMRRGRRSSRTRPTSSGASSRRARWAASGLRVDDCRKTFEELSAKGVTFLQEPSDRPYGVEAVMRDDLRQLAGAGRAQGVHARRLRLTGGPARRPGAVAA